MKLQCDVCVQAAAILICCADEAALCADCDLSVHAANKVAGKHERLHLIQRHTPSCCDICQVKIGLFFCVEDRALLCRDCDVSIHRANQFTRKHTRMLMSGLRVGLEAMPPPCLSPKTSSEPFSFERKTKNTHTNSDLRSEDIPHHTTPQLASLQTTSCSSFTRSAAVETGLHVASPMAQFLRQIGSEFTSDTQPPSCSSLSSPYNYPLSLAACVVSEPMNGSSTAPTFGETASTRNVSITGGWSAMSGAFPMDGNLMTTYYLSEDSNAEVPSTPVTAQHLPRFQDLTSLLKRQRHVDEPFSYAGVAPTFVVPNTMLPPFKQSRLKF